MSDDAAALIEPLSVAVWAARKADIEPGDRVLVTGAGPVGLLCADVARARGARVTVSDTNPNRLAVATARGADAVVDVTAAPLAEQVEPVDVIIECSGAAPAVLAGVHRGRPGRPDRAGRDGRRRPWNCRSATIQIKELQVTGTFRYANCYPAAISLAASGAVDLDGLVTARFGLAEVADALQAARRDPATLKPMVYPGPLTGLTRRHGHRLEAPAG